MKIRLKAPDGYRYYDTKTDRSYSEVVTNEKERDRYTLIPSPNETIIEED